LCGSIMLKKRLKITGAGTASANGTYKEISEGLWMSRTCTITCDQELWDGQRGWVLSWSPVGSELKIDLYINTNPAHNPKKKPNRNLDDTGTSSSLAPQCSQAESEVALTEAELLACTPKARRSLGPLCTLDLLSSPTSPPPNTSMSPEFSDNSTTPANHFSPPAKPPKEFKDPLLTPPLQGWECIGGLHPPPCLTLVAPLIIQRKFLLRLREDSKEAPYTYIKSHLLSVRQLFQDLPLDLNGKQIYIPNLIFPDAAKTLKYELGWEELIARRRKQVKLGKATKEYKSLLATFTTRASRPTDCPQTPPIKAAMSKRVFDGKIRKWRTELHRFYEEKLLTKDQDQTCGNLNASPEPRNICADQEKATIPAEESEIQQEKEKLVEKQEKARIAAGESEIQQEKEKQLVEKSQEISKVTAAANAHEVEEEAGAVEAREE